MGILDGLFGTWLGDSTSDHTDYGHRVNPNYHPGGGLVVEQPTPPIQPPFTWPPSYEDGQLREQVDSLMTVVAKAGSDEEVVSALREFAQKYMAKKVADALKGQDQAGETTNDIMTRAQRAAMLAQNSLIGQVSSSNGS